MKSNDPSIELQPVVDTVCQLYSSKIAADLQADSSHIRRQTLPEFMYSTYLFQTGEPSAAKHALTEFISLVFYFEKVIDVLSTASSPRLFCFQQHHRRACSAFNSIIAALVLRDTICFSGSFQTPHVWKIPVQFFRYCATFCARACLTFLESGHTFDALNIFLAALSFCNFDKIPIIGPDTVFVDSARIAPCCDYIFHNIKQARKEEICMEAKSKFATRHVNIDGKNSLSFSSCFPLSVISK
jgi:hypothetical protein